MFPVEKQCWSLGQPPYPAWQKKHSLGSKPSLSSPTPFVSHNHIPLFLVYQMNHVYLRLHHFKNAGTRWSAVIVDWQTAWWSSKQQPEICHCYWQMVLMTLTFISVKSWSCNSGSWCTQGNMFPDKVNSWAKISLIVLALPSNISRVTGLWSGSATMSPADLKIWEALFVCVLSWTSVRPDPQRCSIFWILSCLMRTRTRYKITLSVHFLNAFSSNISWVTKTLVFESVRAMSVFSTS